MRLEFRRKEAEKLKTKNKERERRLSLEKGGKILKTLGLVVLFCGKKNVSFYIYNFSLENLIYK